MVLEAEGGLGKDSAALVDVETAGLDQKREEVNLEMTRRRIIIRTSLRVVCLKDCLQRRIYLMKNLICE